MQQDAENRETRGTAEPTPGEVVPYEEPVLRKAGHMAAVTQKSNPGVDVQGLMG